MNDEIRAGAGAVAGPFQSVQTYLLEMVHWLKLGVEIISALLVAMGVVLAVYNFIRLYLKHNEARYVTVRLSLARYLALALEFQLGADILSTAIAPSWNEIGQLAVIAVIRTVLNYFLMREMESERQQRENEEKAMQS